MMKVKIDQYILRDILKFSRERHPREMILLLRGNKEDNQFNVTEYLFPPFATGDYRSSKFPIHMLPMDFSIIGTAHSHPRGGLQLSTTDYHNFFGMISIIVAYPYTKSNVASFNKNGDKLKIVIVKTRER